MKSTLTQEQLKLAGPYYRQHPELVGQTFAGPHDTVPKDEVLVMVQKLPDWPTSQYSSSRLLEGSSWVLDWLLTFPGEGWRDRWVAAGADTSPLGWLVERHGADHRDPKTVHKIGSPDASVGA